MNGIDSPMTIENLIPVWFFITSYYTFEIALYRFRACHGAIKQKPCISTGLLFSLIVTNKFYFTCSTIALNASG